MSIHPLFIRLLKRSSYVMYLISNRTFLDADLSNSLKGLYSFIFNRVCIVYLSLEDQDQISLELFINVRTFFIKKNDPESRELTCLQ